MSLASRSFLFSACCVTVGIVTYVHYIQYKERLDLRQGVLRDVERQAMSELKKAENLYILDQQKELEKFLRKEQDKKHST